MPAAPKPENESERLEKLYDYDILDSLPEQRFDDIAALAAKTLGMPVALISLVDKDRQWLKARYGLDVQETPRDHAFCAYTILDRKTFVVENALEHPRVSDNPLVTSEPHIRFYAGAPIITPDKHAIGSLCVIDYKSGTLTDEQLEILEGFARQVSTQLEYTLALKSLSETNGRLLHEQRQAQAAKLSKHQFLANLSHELRTPMNAIMGFTDRLQKRLVDSIPKRDLDSLETVYRNANNLLDMINKLIDIARLEAGAVTVDIQQTSCSSILSQLIESQFAKSRTNGFEVLFEIDTISDAIKADAGLLLKSLEQFASNVALAGNDKQIYLDFLSRSDNSRESWFILSIRNSKESIDQKYRITKQEYGKKEKDVNQSLATMIANEFIEKHDGHTEIRCSNEGDLEFLIHLPILAKPEILDKPDADESRFESTNSNHTILCIDDDSDTLKYMQLTLEDEGFSVLLAHDHDHAINLFETKSPDLICLDICMPGKSGYDVIDTLTKRHGELAVPIVAVTSLGDVETTQKDRLHSVIQKPVSSAKLLTDIKTALELVSDKSAAR
jgi:signal transduction histidine kinase/CheY-like chemotaxis protein